MIRTQTNSKKTFFVFFYVLLVLLCFYPYEFYSVYFLFLPDETYITSIVFIVSTAFIALLGRKLCPPKVVLVSVVILQFLGYFICGVAHGSILGAIDNLITMLLALVLIAYIEGSIGLEAFFKRYNKWILIMAILGTLAFFLISFYGIQPIAIMQDRAGGLEARSLYNYVLTFTKSDESIIGLIRYSGFFDEPGAMAYWGIYALVMNQLFIKDKRLEVILIICLVFTLSLGY